MQDEDEGRVRALADRLAADAGVVLADVAVKGQGGRRLVRVTVDRKGGVPLSVCREVSRKLSSALDEEDPLAGAYVLEVTSPGVDAPLRDRPAFDRVEGREVLVHRSEGGPELRGTVVSAEEDEVVLDTDGDLVRVPYEGIAKATQVLPW